MDDYYSILARAVSRLATNSVQVRRLYEHARTVFTAQLLGQDPQISALETIGERVETKRPSSGWRRNGNLCPRGNPRRLRIIYRILLLYSASLPCQIPDANNSLGVYPPPSHLIPEKNSAKIELLLKFASASQLSQINAAGKGKAQQIRD